MKKNHDCNKGPVKYVNPFDQSNLWSDPLTSLEGTFYSRLNPAAISQHCNAAFAFSSHFDSCLLRSHLQGWYLICLLAHLLADILALKQESRIIRVYWDVKIISHFQASIWTLNRRRGDAHKPDMKAVLTFNTSLHYLIILLSCFRARTHVSLLVNDSLICSLIARSFAHLLSCSLICSFAASGDQHHEQRAHRRSDVLLRGRRWRGRGRAQPLRWRSSRPRRHFPTDSDGMYSVCTGWPISSRTWVGLTWIWDVPLSC